MGGAKKWKKQASGAVSRYCAEGFASVPRLWAILFDLIRKRRSKNSSRRRQESTRVQNLNCAEVEYRSIASVPKLRSQKRAPTLILPKPCTEVEFDPADSVRCPSEIFSCLAKDVKLSASGRQPAFKSHLQAFLREFLLLRWAIVSLSFLYPCALF